MSNNSKFVYTVDIRATPKRIWDAITKPDVTRQFWGHENISNWRQDYEWLHVAVDNNRTVKLVGEVVKVIPQKLLILTWADPMHIEDNSKVTFEIKEIKEKNATCLKIIHNNFKVESKMFEDIKVGWPMVLSSMKSFLETGKPLITWNNN